MYNLIASVVVLVIFAPILGLILKRFSVHEQKYIFIAFLAHIVATLAQVWIHLYYYGYGDMVTYFREGTAVAELLRHDFWHYAPQLLQAVFHQRPDIDFGITGVGHSTGTLGSLASFFAYFTGDSLYASCLITSLLSFCGLIALYAAFPPAISRTYQNRLLISCLMIPSVVFWSSGIIKEAIALAGLGFATYGIFKVFDESRRIPAAISLSAGFILVGLTKSYLLGPLVLASGAWFYATKTKESGQTIKPTYLITALAVSMLAIIGIGELFPRYALDNLTEQISRQQTIVQQQTAGSSSAIFESTDASAKTQLRNLPVATFSVLFRPFFFEAHNIMAFINALETTLITIFFISIVRRRTLRDCWHNLISSPMLVYCLVFTMLCAVGVGLTTVNLGTLSRYRMPMMPFYLILLSVLLPTKKHS